MGENFRAAMETIENAVHQNYYIGRLSFRVPAAPLPLVI
jgi:hypothetical protein